MKKKVLSVLMGMGLLFGVSSNGNTTLIVRSGGMVYDTDLNITWLQDANYAKTSGYDSDGFMTWNVANTWANNLVYGGFSDWRLPSTSDIGNDGCNNWSSSGGTDCGYNVNPSSSEMAHLYYNELGNKGDPDAGWGLANTGPFTNLQPNFYWSGTEYAPIAIGAWDFSFLNGYLGANIKDGSFHAWAVHPGDVATVPEPGTIILLATGIMGIIGYRMKK